MANKEELKTMIKCFRVHELQSLLSFAGRSKNGKKQELQDRALTLLKLQSEPLSFKIRQLYNLMQNGYSNNFIQYPCSEVNVSSSFISDKNDDVSKPCENEDDSISIVDDIETQEKSLCDVKAKTFANAPNSDRYAAQSDSSLHLTLNPLYCSDQPEVMFKKLPFYKVLYELLKPTSLVSKVSHIQQKNSFKFYLTPQQVAAIDLSRSEMHGTHQECRVQGQLRFCSLDPRSDNDDSFPAELVVRVNNKFCNIQDLHGRKRKDASEKKVSPPINITPFMKFNTREANKIEVQWNTEYGLVHMIAVYMVQKKTSDDLLNRLKSKGVLQADHTKKMIEEKLNEEADSEIVTTSLRVSLICPLGKMRLKFPCRASTCQHLQCFDASLFLQMNERTPTWMCPVCDNPAEYDKLVIDEYFLEILSSDQLPPDVNEIELHRDGTWSSALTNPEENSAGDGFAKIKSEPVEEVIDVVAEESGQLGDVTVRSETSMAVGGHPGWNKIELTILEKRKVEEIDLTVSDDDSDDEPLIWHKRRGMSKSSKRNELIDSTPARSINQSPPSVVNLEDSDSSDSLSLVLSNSCSASATPTPTPLVPDFRIGGHDVRDDSGSKGNSDSIMPWFAESTVFF